MSVAPQMDWPSVITTPEESELTTLTHAISEWRRLKEENDIRKQQVREANKKLKVLEEIILRVMKSHQIGALDLKSSGARVLLKKQKRQAALGQKNMVKLIGDYMKSPEEAQKLMTFLEEKKESVIKESITLERLVHGM